MSIYKLFFRAVRRASHWLVGFSEVSLAPRPPNIALWCQVALCEIGINRLDQFVHACKTPVANAIYDQVAEEAFDQIHP